MQASDDDLRRALTHDDPPEGFADRVLARARRLDAERAPRARWSVMAAAAILAGMIVAAGTGAGVYRWQVRQADGMRAKEDVMRALRITSEKLRTAQIQVQQIGRKQFEVND